MKFRLFALVAGVLTGASASAAPILATPVQVVPELQQYVKVAGGRIVLTHVRVIDGTGSAPSEDQTVLIDGPKIAGIRPASAAVPAGYQIIDLTGDSVMPGLVGMHDHLYYIARPNFDAQVIPKIRWSCRR